MVNIIWCLLLLLTIIHITLRYSRFGRLIGKFPGPLGLPIIGNLLLLNTPFEKIWDVIHFHVDYYYPTIGVWFGTYAVVGISHPDDIETYLTSQKNIDKSYAYTFLESWLGTGLITSTGEKWRQRRKILTPAFHFNILKQYMNTVCRNSNIVINNLRSLGDESIQELQPFSARCTLITLIEAAMGIPMEELDSSIVNEYIHAVREFEDTTILRFSRPYIINSIFPLWRSLYKKQQKILTIQRQFEDKLIQKRKEYHKETNYEYLKRIHTDGNIMDEDNIYVGSKKKLAMLDLLLAASMEGLIDDDGIKEEVSTFIFAGHDTSGSALTFMLMLLAENEEIQERARREVTEIINRSGGEIGLNEIHQFHFLERCIKESLRMFPPVGILMREVIEDIEIKNYTIPVGTQVAICAFKTHRDPNFWVDPDKFDPDRFLPERSQGRHPFAYVPFSAGPRNCIGKKFVMMELKHLLGELLYNFRLESIDRTCSVRYMPGLVIQPQKPVRAKFIRIR